jgi:hypothetical protein
MPAEWSDESYFKKEMKRWDAPKREGGMNRDGFERFPMMVYKPQPNPLSGKYEVAISQDVISLDKTVVLLDAEAFNTSCQMVVGNEEELDRAKRGGWRESEAMKYHEDELTRLATEAAHRNHDDRNMSEAAKAEAKKVEDSTPSQVAEIKEKRRANMAKARAAKAAKKLTVETA